MKINELIEIQIKKDPENRIIHEFKLGSFCYDDNLELMAVRLLHFYYLKNIDYTNGYYTFFCELYGYNPDLVEYMVYAFDNSGYFNCGTPRGQWMNEKGRKIYEKYMRAIND